MIDQVADGLWHDLVDRSLGWNLMPWSLLMLPACLGMGSSISMEADWLGTTFQVFLPRSLSLPWFAFELKVKTFKKEHRLNLALIGPLDIPNVEPFEILALPPEETPDLADGQEQFLEIALTVPAVALRAGLYHLELRINGGSQSGFPSQL
jgi:hypothetical protein